MKLRKYSDGLVIMKNYNINFMMNYHGKMISGFSQPRTSWINYIENKRFL